MFKLNCSFSSVSTWFFEVVCFMMPEVYSFNISKCLSKHAGVIQHKQHTRDTVFLLINAPGAIQNIGSLYFVLIYKPKCLSSFLFLCVLKIVMANINQNRGNSYKILQILLF